MRLEKDRLLHMGKAGERAAQIALALTGDESFAEEMFIAGLLHDVGYAFADAKRHGVAGGQVLARCGFKYADAVSRHGSGESLSLAEIIINLADMTTSKTGEQVSMEGRLAEIEKRFGPLSSQYRLALETSSCALRDAWRLTSDFFNAPHVVDESEKAKRKGENKMANQLSFSGNLTADPILHEFNSGSKVCRFDLAQNPRYKDSDGNWQDGTPIYITCEARDYLADRVKDNLVRGNPVIVTGIIRAQEWEDEKTGKPRRKNIVKVYDIAFDMRYHNIEASKAGFDRDNPPFEEDDGARVSSAGKAEQGSEATEDKPKRTRKAAAKRTRKAKPKVEEVEQDEAPGSSEADAAPDSNEVEKDDLF